MTSPASAVKETSSTATSDRRSGRRVRSTSTAVTAQHATALVTVVPDSCTGRHVTDRCLNGGGLGSLDGPVIDVRLLRTEPDEVRAALARRTRPGAARQVDEAPALDAAARAIGARARRPAAAGQRAVQAGRPAAPCRRRRRRRGGCRREPGARRARAGAWQRAGRRVAGTRSASCCCASPTCRTPTPPTAPATPTTRSSSGPVNLPDDVRRAPAGAALGDRRGARHPRQRAGREDQRGDVHDAARARAPRWPGPVPARARPQRRRVRGDPAAVAGHHGDADRHRPAARSSPTTPSPSSATTCGASPPPRCRSRRSSAGEVLDEAELPDAADGLHAVLPARGRLGRARHPRHAAHPRVRQGRDPRLRHARAGAGAAATSCATGPRR